MEVNKQNNEKVELNLEKDLQEVKGWILDFINQLAERLQKMEEVLVVDRIEGNIAVCENRKNGKLQNISLKDLPDNISEGNILKWKNGKYEIDTTAEVQQTISQKMKDVWK